MTETADMAAPPSRDARPVVSLDELRRHCAAVLEQAGLNAPRADLVADSLADAEGRGIASHGVARTRIYARRLRSGMLDPSAEPRIVSERTGGLHLDAGNAIGHVGALAGIQAAVDRASNGAACVVGVSNSNHCGTLAFFARKATEQGLAAIAMSTAPPTMAYFGGRTRAVGTNPICLAVPRRGKPPIVVDMATSATARGKIILAHQLGKGIPDGWAVDENGRPTVDAAEALKGSVLPFAGPKGSGLAMMIDLLCGAMIAGVSGPDIGDMYDDWSRLQRVSHLFMVLNPDAWSGANFFGDYVEEFAHRVHSLPTGVGFDSVLLPGEIEEAAIANARLQGVAISEEVIADLDDIAAEIGLSRRITVLETS